jgi:hypothetical protein
VYDLKTLSLQNLMIRIKKAQNITLILKPLGKTLKNCSLTSYLPFEEEKSGSFPSSITVWQIFWANNNFYTHMQKKKKNDGH